VAVLFPLAMFLPLMMPCVQGRYLHETPSEVSKQWEMERLPKGVTTQNGSGATRMGKAAKCIAQGNLICSWPVVQRPQPLQSYRFGAAAARVEGRRCALGSMKYVQVEMRTQG